MKKKTLEKLVQIAKEGAITPTQQNTLKQSEIIINQLCDPFADTLKRFLDKYLSVDGNTIYSMAKALKMQSKSITDIIKGNDYKQSTRERIEGFMDGDW